jgi:hypothetical protein
MTVWCTPKIQWGAASEWRPLFVALRWKLILPLLSRFLCLVVTDLGDSEQFQAKRWRYSYLPFGTDDLACRPPESFVPTWHSSTVRSQHSWSWQTRLCNSGHWTVWLLGGCFVCGSACLTAAPVTAVAPGNAGHPVWHSTGCSLLHCVPTGQSIA